MTKGFQSDLITMVVWGLGVIFGLAVLLVTYNWITTRQLYEREKQAFEAALTDKMMTRLTEAEQELRAESQAERARVDTALEDTRTEVQTRIRESAEAQREGWSTAVSESSRKLAQLVDNAKEDAQTRSRSVENDVNNFAMEAHVKAESWSSAVSRAIDLIEGAIANENEWYIEGALETLSSSIDKGGMFTKYEITRAPALLKKVPERFRKLADEVARKLASAKVFQSSS